MQTSNWKNDLYGYKLALKQYTAINYVLWDSLCRFPGEQLKSASKDHWLANLQVVIGFS